MKKIYYKNNLSSYYYIEEVNKRLLIISIGPDNPFEFTNILINTVRDYSENITKNNIDVYFDLLSCVGNNENRYSKLTYYKNNPNSFINNIINIESNELPTDILQRLKKFYDDHLNEVLLYSILSNKEKSKLTTSSIV